jgi:hypothetical protein
MSYEVLPISQNLFSLGFSVIPLSFFISIKKQSLFFFFTKEIDIWNSKGNQKSSGHTPQER